MSLWTRSSSPNAATRAGRSTQTTWPRSAGTSRRHGGERRREHPTGLGSPEDPLLRSGRRAGRGAVPRQHGTRHPRARRGRCARPRRAPELASRREQAMNNPVRIAIVGGGFAGLESAFLLRSRLGARADLTLISKSDSFLFKPNTIYIPFGADLAPLLIPLARPTSKRDIRLVRGEATSIDPDHRRVDLSGDHLGERVRYDFLVLASGADMSPEE